MDMFGIYLTRSVATQRFFLFLTPNLGEMIQYDLRIFFQMGGKIPPASF